MKTAPSAFALLAALGGMAALGGPPARAAGPDEGQARAKMQAAGYGDVTAVHEGNLGEWMAQATRDGRHVMIVLHPDGSVALRQQIDVPPAQPVGGMDLKGAAMPGAAKP